MAMKELLYVKQAVKENGWMETKSKDIGWFDTMYNLDNLNTLKVQHSFKDCILPTAITAEF